MSAGEKKLEAVGDGLLLACARLYLRDRCRGIPYELYTRLTSRMVNNRTLTLMAKAEGIHPGPHGAADAFEREIARMYYSRGFRDTKRWLWSLFDRHMDIEEEARRILDPSEKDRLLKVVRGALKNAMRTEGQQIPDKTLETATKQIVSHLKNEPPL